MFGQARTILWAQFRTLLNFYSRGNRAGFWFAVIMSALWYGGFVVAAVSLAIFFADAARMDLIRRTLPAGLLIVFLYWQVVPLMLASAGASLDLRRLVVYPVTKGQLFAIEVILRLTTGVEMILLLAGATVGLLRNEAVPFWSPLFFIPFVLMNLFLSAGLRDLLGRMLQRRGIRELVILGLVLLTALPQLLLLRATPGGIRSLNRGAAIAWGPWTMAGKLAGGELVWWAAAGLLLWTTLAYAFGRWQFERGFRFDAEAARATRESNRRSVGWMDPLFRLPSLVFRDPLAAVIEKELRFLSRAPRFRLVFFMGFSFGLLIWLPLAFRPGGAGSTMANNYLTFVTVYALLLLGEVSFWNSFGFDRSAVQFYYLAPARMSTVLLGKNIASAVFVLLEITAVTAVCVILRMPITPAKLAESYAVAMVLALFLVAAGNLGSTYYPRPVDPAQSWRSAAAGRMQALLLFLYPVLSVPIVLAYLARYAFDGEWAFWTVLAFDAVLAATVYWVAMDSAIQAAERRKEKIITALSQGEGPISA